MVPWVMPPAASASSLIRKCVVLAGWMTRLLASPTLARWLNTWSDSTKALPCARLPLMSKLKTLPAPLGNSFLASAWDGWLSNIGCPTCATKGCAAKNSTTLAVFKACRSMRSDRVSMPCKISQALCGDRQAPKSRRPSRRARSKKAPTVLSSVNTIS